MARMRFADGRSFTMNLDFLAHRVLSDADEAPEGDVLGFFERNPAEKLSDEGLQEIVNYQHAGGNGEPGMEEGDEAPLFDEFEKRIAPLALSPEEKAALWKVFVVARRQFERMYEAYACIQGVPGAVPAVAQKTNGSGRILECYSMEKYGMPCFSGSPCVRVTLRGRGAAKLLRSLEPFVES